MNKIYQHYIIDLSSNNNFVHIPTVQGDGNGIRGFEVELIENGVQYEIDKNDCIIAIMGTKPDTSQIMNDCTVSDEGYILVDITSQMSAVKGRGDYQIVLMSRSTNSQLKSFPFHIITTPAAFDIDYIVSSDEFQALTKNIVRTEEVIGDAHDAISDLRALESSVETAEEARVEAEKKRVDTEDSRVSAESIRESNEAARQNAEKNRSNAETNRESAEAIRVSNENTRKSNETNRKNAETARVDAENDRSSAETIRNTNEDIRIVNENARKGNETSRVDAEKDRVSSESARRNNETIRQTNETVRQTNTSNAIANANKATDRAETVADRAEKAAEACEGIVSAGIVLQTEKGAANGVATLDADGKLTGDQLPIATASVLGGVKIGSNITVDNGTINVSKKNVTDALNFTPTAELISSTEPVTGKQSIGDFWLQEYT